MPVKSWKKIDLFPSQSSYTKLVKDHKIKRFRNSGRQNNNGNQTHMCNVQQRN